MVKSCMKVEGGMIGRVAFENGTTTEGGVSGWLLAAEPE